MELYCQKKYQYIIVKVLCYKWKSSIQKRNILLSQLVVESKYEAENWDTQSTSTSYMYLCIVLK